MTPSCSGPSWPGSGRSTARWAASATEMTLAICRVLAGSLTATPAALTKVTTTTATIVATGRKCVSPPAARATTTAASRLTAPKPSGLRTVDAPMPASAGGTASSGASSSGAVHIWLAQTTTTTTTAATMVASSHQACQVPRSACVPRGRAGNRIRIHPYISHYLPRRRYARRNGLAAVQHAPIWRVMEGSAEGRVPHVVLGVEAFDFVQLDIGVLGLVHCSAGDPPFGSGQARGQVRA